VECIGVGASGASYSGFEVGGHRFKYDGPFHYGPYRAEGFREIDPAVES
jgi:hypothetical protein